ncbi:NBR1-Ig-like domain-containing protein [Actinomadura harenae]|uniref:Nbr1 FW domain-containing protein n=1 Tax=Actinomadura harenae TaxID=2483351 RepID=A0A3M2MEC5_9ACTN|nr:NBR1-Ig-like domain-containing protein [Actinomadura harenae]RMI47849.1 hypothetical protein EBO15_00735 [Actinomadura harenae]
MDAIRARAEAIEHFAELLRELRSSVGNPSFREMSGRSRAISHATLHEATRGNRLPSWATTVEFVKACGGDPEAYRERWEKANLAVRSVTTGGHPVLADPDPDPASASVPGEGSPSGKPPGGEASGGEAAADVPLGEALPADWGTGELLPVGGGATEPRPVDLISGEVLLTGTATERRRRVRPNRRVTAVSAAVGVGVIAVCAVAVARGSFDSGGHALNPSGAESEATAACPVVLPQPSPTPPAHDGDASIFVMDVTLPDCAHVAPGKTVTKTWRIKNIGTVPWTGYSLIRLDLPQGDDDCRTPARIPVRDTEPGQVVDISADVSTPGRPGLCYVRFKMLDASGTVAFPGKRPVNFQIVVDAP